MLSDLHFGAALRWEVSRLYEVGILDLEELDLNWALLAFEGLDLGLWLLVPVSDHCNFEGHRSLVFGKNSSPIGEPTS